MHLSNMEAVRAELAQEVVATSLSEIYPWLAMCPEAGGLTALDFYFHMVSKSSCHPCVS